MRASDSQKQERSQASRSAWRRALTISLLILAFAGTVFAAQQIEQFLIRDPRFALTPPAEYGEESLGIRLNGIQFASRADVMRVFQQDIGRSLYLLPLADRRKALLRVPWIKEASILRTWPHQINVYITERQPVAFLQIRSESISRWSLIDQDGVVLEPPLRTPFELPVVSGIRLQESQTMRASRIRRMLRLLDDIGASRSRISEVDVTDLDNLKVSLRVGKRAIVLMLGDHNFHTRFQNFLDHYEEIRNRIADVSALDLQLDGRIFSVPDQPVQPRPPAKILQEHRLGK